MTLAERSPRNVGCPGPQLFCQGVEGVPGVATGLPRLVGGLTGEAGALVEVGVQRSLGVGIAEVIHGSSRKAAQLISEIMAII